MPATEDAHLSRAARDDPCGDLGVDRLRQLFRGEARVAQDLCGRTLLDARQAQQQVLRAYPSWPKVTPVLWTTPPRTDRDMRRCSER